MFQFSLRPIGGAVGLHWFFQVLLDRVAINEISHWKSRCQTGRHIVVLFRSSTNSHNLVSRVDEQRLCLITHFYHWFPISSLPSSLSAATRSLWSWKWFCLKGQTLQDNCCCLHSKYINHPQSVTSNVPCPQKLDSPPTSPHFCLSLLHLSIVSDTIQLTCVYYRPTLLLYLKVKRPQMAKAPLTQGNNVWKYSNTFMKTWSRNDTLTFSA